VETIQVVIDENFNPTTVLSYPAMDPEMFDRNPWSKLDRDTCSHSQAKQSTPMDLIVLMSILASPFSQALACNPIQRRSLLSLDQSQQQVTCQAVP
jgi:hypothetical protein